jgi:hypothetical protein
VTTTAYDRGRQVIGGSQLARLSLAAVARWASRRAAAWWAAVTAPVGRRGTVLLAMGAGFVVTGVRLWGPQTTSNLEAFGPFVQLLPVGAWGAVFVVAGLVAVVSAWAPPGRDAPGFAALTGLAWGWGVSNLVGSSWGWSAGALWLLATVPLLVVAGWDERDTAPP